MCQEDHSSSSGLPVVLWIASPSGASVVPPGMSRILPHVAKDRGRACLQNPLRNPLDRYELYNHPVKVIFEKLTSYPLDGHDDFPLLVRFLYNNHIYAKNFTKPFEEGGLPQHVDLARLRSGQNGGAFWSVYAPCPANGSDWSDENYRTSESHRPS